MNRGLPALLLAVGCPVPAPRADVCLEPARASVQERWPTARAALDDEDVYGQAVWFWAHQRSSVDGFGVVLATISRRPRLDVPEDRTARGATAEPSLLFFDREGEDPEGWPLIGMGYHFDFEPCERPTLECADPTDFFVHEAGYHRVPFGDGGMDVATADDVRPGTTLDADACEIVRTEDLQPRVGSVRHGRAWVTHVWFPPDGEDGPPLWAALDPWERWTDATVRSTADGEAFFEQGSCACDDSGLGELPRRGCAG